jgi:FxLD family lantipeptide
MPPLLLLDAPDAPPGVEVDDEFALNLRVVEISGPIPISLCDTGDGCGDTCNGSACTSNSNDPTLL